ncbi:MAG: LysR family transcriptional regulator [Sulfitobacter sp.]
MPKTLTTDISHHLRNLEDHLGVELLNHARRPMVLTPKGRVFLRNIEDALYSIRKAKAEASAGDIAGASFLRVGSIEDFDSDIIPDLAVYLSKNMAQCDFLYQTETSHAIMEMLRNRQLDLGITDSHLERLRELQDRPILRDPFVVALPVGLEQSLLDVVEGRAKLPLLRFSSSLIIARQIEAQLRRLGASSRHSFECDNNQTLMAMVAAGTGWAITTPLLFSRAQRFHSKVQIHPFPGKDFSRTLAILSTPDCSRSILDLVDKKMRMLITDRAINPLCQKFPWLQDGFVLLP